MQLTSTPRGEVVALLLAVQTSRVALQQLAHHSAVSPRAVRTYSDAMKFIPLV